MQINITLNAKIRVPIPNTDTQTGFVSPTNTGTLSNPFQTEPNRKSGT